MLLFQLWKLLGRATDLGVARAVPEILYFRCPVCSKRFPGSAFGEDDLQAECEACGALVDSPNGVVAVPNDRAVESPFTLVEIAQEMNSADGVVAQTEDITQQMRLAFDALSQTDKTKFLEETMPKVDLPVVEDCGTSSSALRLTAIGVLLVIGVLLLTLLYFQG